MDNNEPKKVVGKDYNKFDKFSYKHNKYEVFEDDKNIHIYSKCDDRDPRTVYDLEKLNEEQKKYYEKELEELTIVPTFSKQFDS